LHHRTVIGAVDNHLVDPFGLESLQGPVAGSAQPIKGRELQRSSDLLVRKVTRDLLGGSGRCESAGKTNDNGLLAGEVATEGDPRAAETGIEFHIRHL